MSSMRYFASIIAGEPPAEYLLECLHSAIQPGATQAQAAPAQLQNNAAQLAATAQLNPDTPANTLLNPTAMLTTRQRKRLIQLMNAALLQPFGGIIANQHNAPAS